MKPKFAVKKQYEILIVNQDGNQGTISSDEEKIGTSVLENTWFLWILGTIVINAILITTWFSLVGLNDTILNPCRDSPVLDKTTNNGNQAPNLYCPIDLEDELKFDCLPQNANESECTKRGCCWTPSDKEFVPFCYYPSNYAIYSFVNVSKLSEKSYNGVEAYLQLNGGSGYPEDIQLLKLVATFETRSRLRVKIVDPTNERYEVNVFETSRTENVPLSGMNETDYEFLIDTKVPGFSVVRKSSQETLFSSIGVGGFVYANQFLQISTLLPSGNIYGFGEHQDSMRHSMNWQRLTLFAHDEIPGKGKNLYGAHPFYLVMENNGLSHGVFLKNSDPMDIVLQPAPAISFRVLGGILDFYFFLGPTPGQVVEQYTEVIGRPAMPPYWGLGFHLCRYNYGSLNRTREIWQRTRRAGIPFDVQWNDLDYMDTNKDFTYDPTSFAGLPDFVQHLHSVGMHYIPLIDPGISNAELASGYPPYDQGIEMRVFVKNSTESSSAPFVGKVWNTVSTVWPDFTHPNATEYWTRQLEVFHQQVPFDGAWIDMNEPSNFYSGTVDGCPRDNQWDNPPYTPAVVGEKLYFRTLCMSAGQHAGRHYDVHNLYGMTETMVTNRALKSIRRKRPFIISRSTFPGQGHYGGHWTGDVVSDWTNLRRSIAGILNYNMYGIPLVGADICGFNGNTTSALCQRWMELGAFYPFSRNHNTDDAIDQDPVALGPAVVEASKKALNIRYSLLPYLYTLFWQAASSGATVARPLFFEFPLDRQTYSIDTQFLWGAALMIAPVLTPDTFHVELYLPDSLWYDYYTLELVSTGGAWTRLPAPLDTIPLLLRGGYIVATQAANVTTASTRLNPFHLLVALNGSRQAAGRLYLDDGDSIDSDLSVFNDIHFTASVDGVRSELIHWNYDDAQAQLDHISLMGLNVPISTVEIDGHPHRDFQYNTSTAVLLLRNCNLHLKKPFSISYH